ncbi:hypothetical protein A1332_23185 [Methylomonas methanica]|uniref:Uncharacterized protein n=1 Tax=Methylomonas methanica TaxID=421 RepID=A0A177LUJ8_METMH|nr:hypothetical protein A1332_23185 [Methylomonas methanica]
MIAPENLRVLQNLPAVLVRNSAIAQNYSNVRARRENARAILENGREKSLAVLPANRSVRQNLSAVLTQNSAIGQNNSNVGARHENVRVILENSREKSSAVPDPRATGMVFSPYAAPSTGAFERNSP